MNDQANFLNRLGDRLSALGISFGTTCKELEYGGETEQTGFPVNSELLRLAEQ
jgi:hypothetical protein